MQSNKHRPASRLAKGLTALAAVSLASILAWGVWALPPYPHRMQALVSENMHRSGVENPVTAVLLNFRGYDTLLEIGVLLSALVSVLAVTASRAPSAVKAPRPILLLFLRLCLPMIILFSGYILWVGKYAPGGAFQAGALLAGGGILYLTITNRPIESNSAIVRLGMSAGLMVFGFVGLASMIARGQFLEYPPALAGTWILVIEAAATVSIGVILTLLFVGAGPSEESPRSEEKDPT